jgi:hypothetical protein
MDKKLYLVETVQVFRHRYVVEAKEEEHAADTVVMDMGNPDFKEFSQKHIDENITDVREISKDEFFTLFDRDNDYLRSWNEEQKLSFINTINYEEDTNGTTDL